MKIIDKIIQKFYNIKEEREQTNYWREQFNHMRDCAAERSLQIERQIKKILGLEEQIQALEQEISELKDEIDVQKSKAAKYLSYYLELLEKHLQMIDIWGIL